MSQVIVSYMTEKERLAYIAKNPINLRKKTTKDYRWRSEKGAAATKANAAAKHERLLEK
ncbi:hypothetical protein [Peribacillus aracenensis]|uniref:hypothetical protein n=1 Tax=Peribacillus aracenensis TaxID=2976708 RepID=UPI0021A6AA2E|nr:hypothetical protein [Peribacillus sp. BBB004]